MKTKRFATYLDQKKQAKTTPITKKEEVNRHTDQKIDEDFPGFPHGQSKEKMIQPKTATEKKTAAIQQKDGEKRTYKKSSETDEQASDGSGGAFGGTEEVKD